MAQASLAVLVAVPALSDFSKPFHLDPNPDFVFFGTKAHGIAKAMLAPTLSADGRVRHRHRAHSIAYFDAAYLLLYGVRNTAAAAGFMVAYSAVAIAMSTGNALFAATSAAGVGLRKMLLEI